MHEVELFLSAHKKPLKPFEAVLVDFCDALSKALFAAPDVKQVPDIVALAFWLRKAHIDELKLAFERLNQPHQLSVPRGLVFHLAPANVETQFVYSWILSLLVGNANIVRLPSRESPGLNLLFHTLNTLLQQPEFRLIQKTTCLLSYGHEHAVTEAISAQADMRVLWGGDETIRTIRKIPLKALAHEIGFGDRYAMAVIDVAAYQAASDAERQNLVHAFYSDVFWYDQMACSSPRTLFWVGHAPAASQDFFKRLQKHLESKRYRLPLALALQKETYLYSQAIELNIAATHRLSNELTIVELDAFDPNCRMHCGAGLLYSVPLRDLHEMIQYVSVKDQTLTHYGFSSQALNGLALALNGRGLERIVPIGQALNFDYVWDGYNLLREFTKVVNVRV